MKEYKIIHRTSRSTIEDDINEAVGNGFTMVGTVQFFMDDDDYHYIATMARDARKPNNVDDLRDPAQAQA